MFDKPNSANLKYLDILVYVCIHILAQGPLWSLRHFPKNWAGLHVLEKERVVITTFASNFASKCLA